MHAPRRRPRTVGKARRQPWNAVFCAAKALAAAHAAAAGARLAEDPQYTYCRPPPHD